MVRSYAIILGILFALAALNFASAYEASGWSFSSYGPGLVGNQWNVNYYGVGQGSYSLSRTAYGDYWGGYSEVRSGQVYGGSFGYSNTYGLTYANVYNPSVRTNIYRSPYGDYGGYVNVGSRVSWTNVANYPAFYGGYNGYALRYPNYYGSSLY